MKPRIFFPTFSIAMMRPKIGSDPRKIFFKIPREMTKIDLKLYLKEIYGVDAYFIRSKIPRDLSFGESERYIKADFRIAMVSVKEPFKFPHVDHFFTKEIKEAYGLKDIKQPEECHHVNGPPVAKRGKTDQFHPRKLEYNWPVYNIPEKSKNSINLKNENQIKPKKNWIDNWFNL